MDNAKALSGNATKELKTHRKKFLIDPLQIKFALYSIVVFSIAALGLWLETRNGLKGLQDLAVRYDPTSPLIPQMKNVSIFFSQIFLIKLIVVMLFIWMIAIFVSHRFVGPLYRLRESLKKVRDHDLSVRMNLRKGDAFQDIAKLFNEMMDALEKGNKVR